MAFRSRTRKFQGKARSARENKQNALFKRSGSAVFSREVEQIDYKDVDSCATSSAKTARSRLLD